MVTPGDVGAGDVGEREICVRRMHVGEMGARGVELVMMRVQGYGSWGRIGLPLWGGGMDWIVGRTGLAFEDLVFLVEFNFGS